MKNIKISFVFAAIIATSTYGFDINDLFQIINVMRVVTDSVQIVNSISAENVSRTANAECARQEAQLAFQAREKLEAVHAFRQCLIANRLTNNLGASGIPKDCEDKAAISSLLGCKEEIDVIIDNFKEIRKKSA